jgi:hypothetical protein
MPKPRLCPPRQSLAFVLLAAVGLLVLTGCASSDRPVHLLTRANALPLAIDPAIQVRKVKYYFLESPLLTGERNDVTNEEQSIAYERSYLTFGAITGSDIRNRYGDYYTFFWRNTHREPRNLTVRLEYRQQKTGGFVQAREVDYPAAQGSYVTRFAINGDDYLQEGRVTAWRVVIIENHEEIVAFHQSYLWR